ncbi:MAG: hypothetical protein WKG01_35965 [Kofleriaceae bacterium]
MLAALTVRSTVQCMHGGTVILRTANTTSSAGAAMLLESDVHDVIGCGFFAGSTYSPCRTVEWSAGARALRVGGTKVLVKTSVGVCKNAGGAIQGTARVNATQTSVSGK